MVDMDVAASVAAALQPTDKPSMLAWADAVVAALPRERSWSWGGSYVLCASAGRAGLRRCSSNRRLAAGSAHVEHVLSNCEAECACRASKVPGSTSATWHENRRGEMNRESTPMRAPEQFS